MSQISTALTRLLGIRTPIVSASMNEASGGALAARVTLGGAFGFMAGAVSSLDNFQRELSLAQSLLSNEISVQEPQANPPVLPIGVGFLGWALDGQNPAAAQSFDLALQACVKAIWLAFGDNIEKWVQRVREADSTRDHKTLVFVNVGSVQHAKRVAEQGKADVLVAQGLEAGGHNYSDSLPIVSLIAAILRELPKDRPPILASGGIATGAQIASMLTLGADGVAIGTRYLLTDESIYPPEKKAALLNAGSLSTVRSSAYDKIMERTQWPKGVTVRGLRNPLVEKVEKGESLQSVIEEYKWAQHKKDPSALMVWAGTSIGIINDLKPALELTNELHEDTVAQLHAAASLITPSND